MSFIENYLRWRTGRGFGVQSPSAYGFIRYVIKESYPYYCYEELRNKHSCLSASERNKLELIFRLTNFWRPKKVFTDDITEYYYDYISAGCIRSIISKYEESDNNLDECSLYIIRCTNDIVDRVRRLSNPKCLVVLENIRKSKEWNTLVLSDFVVRSYDINDIGILFFDHSKLKENFRLSL